MPAPSPPSSATVTTAHQATYPDPLHVQAGEPVQHDGQTADWHGHTWAWCTDARGKSGWVPQPYLEHHGDTWIITHDYNAIELSVHPGETLTTAQAVGGWVWTTNAPGQSGWVPAQNLAFPPDMI